MSNMKGITVVDIEVLANLCMPDSSRTLDIKKPYQINDRVFCITT